MKFNLHTHTPRCLHARGSEREYVEAAIAAGIETLGFSDHTPMIFPGDYYSRMRMRPEETAGYLETLRALREEYRGRIEILLGFEAEYYPSLFERYLEYISQFEFDYLILGQHFLYDEVGTQYVARPTTLDSDLIAYTDQCCAGMRSGVFTYLAHPDVINYHPCDSALYDAQMERICRTALETDTPLEINILGAREGRNYPNERFWQMAGRFGNRVLLGCDAHSPNGLDCPEAEQRCREMAARCGIEVLERVPLKKPF